MEASNSISAGENGKGGLGLGHGCRISQLFLPEHCVNLGRRRGYLIGWNNRSSKFLVATVVTVDEGTGLPTLAQVERSVETFAKDVRYRTLNAFCSGLAGGPPTVLGEWLPDGSSSCSSSNANGPVEGRTAGAGAAAAAAEVPMQRQWERVWITVGREATAKENGVGRPVLRSIGVRGTSSSETCRSSCMILYRACNSDAGETLEYIPTLGGNASLYEYYYDCDDDYDEKDVEKDYDSSNGRKKGDGDSDSSGRSSGMKHSVTVAGVGSSRVRAVWGMGWGRTGHGTALVSPSARARESGAADGGVIGLDFGVIGDGRGESGGGGETDLELAMRQVSCARVLEIGVLEALQRPDVDPTLHNRRTLESGENRGKGDDCPPFPDSKKMFRLPALAEVTEDSSSRVSIVAEHEALLSTAPGKSSEFSSPVQKKEKEKEKENKGLGDGKIEGGMRGSVSGGIIVVLQNWFWFLVGVSSWLACLAVRVLEARVVWTPLGEETWQSLSDVSLACAHLARRLRTALALPFKLRQVWRERRLPGELRAAGVIDLRGGVFGIMADALLGAAACLVLLRHKEGAAQAAHQALHLLHVDVLREELEWLNFFPAGFKLNVPLTLTLGSCTLFSVEAYASIVGKLTPWEGAAMVAIALSAAVGGLATSLAVTYDALRLLTAHTAGAHAAFSALHNVHSSLLASLWRLFRGRKRNILRCRVDSCGYDASRLLLGTLVFTVLFFLTPTVAVYYTFFCIVHAVAIGVQAMLISLFIMVNELPAYGLFLFITNPDRLLTGFHLQILDAPHFSGATLSGQSSKSSSEGKSESTTVYFQLQRCRAPASSLLRPYVTKATQLAVRRYPPSSLTKSLLLGNPLPAVRLRDVLTAVSPNIPSRVSKAKKKSSFLLDLGVGTTNSSSSRSESDGEMWLPSPRAFVRECRSLLRDYYGRRD